MYFYCLRQIAGEMVESNVTWALYILQIINLVWQNLGIKIVITFVYEKKGFEKRGESGTK